MNIISYFGLRPYAMKLHHATRLHFDLRLEVNGVLLSWAISADLSLGAGKEYEAIEMDDHKLANIHFEGVRETGIIMLWDRGAWEPLTGFEEVVRCVHNGLLRFGLHGERLKGIWTLLKTDKTRGTRPVWILRKESDAFAVEGDQVGVLARWPNSVDTRRRIEEVQRDWINPARKREKHPSLFDENTKP